MSSLKDGAKAVTEVVESFWFQAIAFVAVPALWKLTKKILGNEPEKTQEIDMPKMVILTAAYKDIASVELSRADGKIALHAEAVEEKLLDEGARVIPGQIDDLIFGIFKKLLKLV
jgi:hypothetical protein